MRARSHAFGTPHVLNRAGGFATEEVAEIVTQAAPPDRRQPHAPGREWEIAAPTRSPWPR
jgi:hypothetical protein